MRFFRYLTSLARRLNLSQFFYISLSLWALSNLLFISQPFSEQAIYEYYTKGYFEKISSLMHLFYGIFPFSVGDIYYILIGILSVYLIYRVVAEVWSKNYKIAARLMSNLFAVYFLILFILGIQWNWNYQQSSIESKLSMSEEKYSLDQLAEFTNYLIDLAEDEKSKSNFRVFSNPNTIIDISIMGYEGLTKNYDLLNHNSVSIKYSLFSDILPYFGVSGYYNPFTGEAQITKGIPIIQLPFVINHELAHQMGIASEAEANFVSFLASKHNPLPEIRYSGYLNVIIYCLSDLKSNNYHKYKELTSNIPTAVKQDIVAIVNYWSNYQNQYREYSDWAYDLFLKSNFQTEGLESYNRVVLLVYKHMQAEKEKRE